MNQLAPLTAHAHLPVLVTAADDRACLRFHDFFAANIRNPHTRRAYGPAVDDFLT
jgi:integrase/recombinase XerC